jgi:predicted nuclease with TOPRIM domain
VLTALLSASTEGLSGDHIVGGVAGALGGGPLMVVIYWLVNRGRAEPKEESGEIRTKLDRLIELVTRLETELKGNMRELQELRDGKAQHAGELQKAAERHAELSSRLDGIEQRLDRIERREDERR